MPDKLVQVGRAGFGAAELSILENSNLCFGDSIVARVNGAKAAAHALHAPSPLGPGAQHNIVGGGYDIEKFDRFNNPGLNAAKTVL